MGEVRVDSKAAWQGLNASMQIRIERVECMEGASVDNEQMASECHKVRPAPPALSEKSIEKLHAIDRKREKKEYELLKKKIEDLEAEKGNLGGEEEALPAL